LRLTLEDAYESGSGQRMVGIGGTAATGQDSSKLMEFVAEILKELHDRDRKHKSAVVNKAMMKAPLG